MFINNTQREQQCWIAKEDDDEWWSALLAKNFHHLMANEESASWQPLFFVLMLDFRNNFALKILW
jgi:hypothetical protein